MSTFTIITGSGRCGTSALTKFFQNWGELNVHATFNEVKDMKAGFESHEASVSNAYLSKNVHYPHLIHNKPNKGISLIKDLTNTYDLVKTPSFFIYNTYEYWKKHNSKCNIQVILLKRTHPTEVYLSAKNTPRPMDWEIFKNVDTLEKQYNINRKSLTDLNIPYIEIEYPLFIKDLKYLYANLNQLDFNIPFKKIKQISKKSFNNQLITSYEKV